MGDRQIDEWTIEWNLVIIYIDFKLFISSELLQLLPEKLGDIGDEDCVWAMWAGVLVLRPVSAGGAAISSQVSDMNNSRHYVDLDYIKLKSDMDNNRHYVDLAVDYIKLKV